MDTHKPPIRYPSIANLDTHFANEKNFSRRIDETGSCMDTHKPPIRYPSIANLDTHFANAKNFSRRIDETGIQTGRVALRSQNASWAIW
jgi:hypothetical protein